MLLSAEKVHSDVVADVFSKAFAKYFPIPKDSRVPLCASYHGSNARKGDTLSLFQNGKIRALAVCGMLLEGFDHKPVSVVAILRNMGKDRQVLFTQFVGRAIRRHRDDEPMGLHAVVISHAFYKQRKNFEDFEKYESQAYYSQDRKNGTDTAMRISNHESNDDDEEDELEQSGSNCSMM